MVFLLAANALQFSDVFILRTDNPQNRHLTRIFNCRFVCVAYTQFVALIMDMGLVLFISCLLIHNSFYLHSCPYNHIHWPQALGDSGSANGHWLLPEFHYALFL